MRATGTAISSQHIPAELFATINALCAASIDVAGVIARGSLDQSLSAQVGENSDGDGQKALDVMADEMFEAVLRGGDVKWYASEEQEDALHTSETGKYALAIDPLDGSSNIDVNVSVGTIFSIFDAKDGAEESFLRPAREQICGGYIVYGPAVMLVITFGKGTQQYVLDTDKGEFILTDEAMKIPTEAKEFAINASNFRNWTPPVRAYIDACLDGKDGPLGKTHNMRWVGSLIAEAHRILTRGGVFLYPGDSRPGYENGRLRMVYECAPVAFLIEQAQGKATDGKTPILDRQADKLHGRIPLVFGSADMVDDVADRH